MKKFTVLFMFIFVFSITGFSQKTDIPSAGPIPVNLQTSEVIINNGEVINFSNSATAFAFQTFPTPTRFVTFPIPGFAVTEVSQQIFTDFASSGVFAPSGTFFLTTASTATPPAPSQLYKINTSTGVPTLIANMTGDVIISVNGITYDPVTGIFYVVNATSLGTIDTSTGATTLIGNFNLGASSLMVEVAVDCNGNMYGFDLGLDNLYSINKSTGAATLIGPLGFNLNFGCGATYDKVNSILYLFGLDGAGNINALRSVNVTTGQATVVQTWNPTLSQFAPFDLFGNVCGVIPVELKSFNVTTSGNDVVLAWETATETNNMGFEVERKSDNGEFVNIGMVGGHGTTTEPRNYIYTDANVASGSYTYRLKQVDFDGTFEYSSAIEVDVNIPAEFSLGQNYPNPFNPSTTINFALKVDSKVSLRIFDALGQEVKTLLNDNYTAGVYNIDVNASALNSGVYFYTLEASGVDGSKFAATKKMILMK